MGLHGRFTKFYMLSSSGKADKLSRTTTGGMVYGGVNSVLDLLESILSLTALKIAPYETVCHSSRIGSVAFK